MTSFNKAQLGKRVYKGAGFAPNRGQVSAKGAQGYIKRELAKKNRLKSKRLGGATIGTPKGKDGKSDSRSAVAALALKRMQRSRNGR